LSATPSAFLTPTLVLDLVVAAFEALLFAMMGKVVDWLSHVPPAEIWSREGEHLVWLSIVLILSVAFIALQTLFKHQTLAGNFPMRLRWNFHRLMLNQSMSF
jgi:ATP-binding cassette subfamily B multidrug efflux pump